MPARAGDVMRAARKLGAVVEPPNHGSHYKVKAPGGRPYPLPCHNGEREELSDKYIKGLCRNFGWDYKAFKGLL